MPTLLSAIWLALFGAACAASSPLSPAPSTAPPAPLDGLIFPPATSARSAPLSHQRCLDAISAEGPCPPRAGARREIPLRIVLDGRYTTAYPNWRDRLQGTLRCVNRLYQSTAISWRLDGVTIWDPGAERHDLFPLLNRLRTSYTTDLRSLLVGITVWEGRRVYSGGGGEIGLSQGDACVVPSWPRLENDCLILAHELGHLVGATHVPGKRWVMSWSASPFHLPAGDATARLVATYRFHPRNIAVIDTHVTAVFTREGLRPTPACQQRIAAIDRCWGL